MMATFIVYWNKPDSADPSSHETVVEDVPTMAHAAWVAAERVFDCTYPSGRQLLDVVRLS
jgi:hypothetical protein